ncbi:hypothetical protein BDV33DRAFT_184469 [Aspergillus novoparasiticus]|uniref:Uncharacterized protein n=1 Tax=Aspergillus novoparasiticus TaxID=986946 RepID=A0A5N6E7P6_9EURO|nr:hypothetical protein BDV33DRAFT_184469 [Aspergillus novoparasiticus]
MRYSFIAAALISAAQALPAIPVSGNTVAEGELPVLLNYHVPRDVGRVSLKSVEDARRDKVLEDARAEYQRRLNALSPTQRNEFENKYEPKLRLDSQGYQNILRDRKTGEVIQGTDPFETAVNQLSNKGSENGGPKAPVTDPNTAASPADAESAMNLLTGPTRESFNNLMGQPSDRPSQGQTSNDINVGMGQVKEGVPSDMAAFNQIVNQPSPAYDSLRQSFNEGKYVPGVDGFDSSDNPIFGDQGKYDAAVWG